MKLSREHVQDLTRTPLHQGLKIFSFQAESLWSVSAASLTFLFPSVFTIVILFWLHHCVLSEREVSECVCVCVCVCVSLVRRSLKRRVAFELPSLWVQSWHCCLNEENRVHCPVWDQGLCCLLPTHHNYWACAPEPECHNYWSPCALELLLCNKRSHHNEKPEYHT